MKQILQWLIALQSVGICKTYLKTHISSRNTCFASFNSKVFKSIINFQFPSTLKYILYLPQTRARYWLWIIIWICTPYRHQTARDTNELSLTQPRDKVRNKFRHRAIYVHIHSQAMVIIWDYHERRIKASHEIHKVRVEDVSFSCESNFLISLGGRDDGNVVIWDVNKNDAICGI